MKNLYILSKRTHKMSFLFSKILAAIFLGSHLFLLRHHSGFAQTQVDLLDEFCRFPQGAIAQKVTLQQASLEGNPQVQERYHQLVQNHAEILQACRQGNWPQHQAIWLRLYPCDLQPGALDRVFDRIVNLGYNQVFVEVFYDGRVLLPAANNPTSWPSVVLAPGYEEVDLFAQAIETGKARGLDVYAWMFTLNFGYSYTQLNDRQSALAQNSRGETSLDLIPTHSQVFVDPYSPQARSDYRTLIQEVLRRQPDGVLFDYIRYPRGTGSQSVVSRVQDLLIYSNAARQALLDRANNNQGRELIDRFLQQGYIGIGDIEQVNQLYPAEPGPLWQGRHTNFQDKSDSDSAAHQARLQQELWFLSVAHAQRGILDFLNLAIVPVHQATRSSGAVFFPGGNQAVGSGFDSRLQPWPNFPPSSQWHPMAYTICGNTDCILAEIKQVLAQASPETKVQPALAGSWGQPFGNRPSLESQMIALRSALPELQAISHFAYSWQYPEDDNQRKFCKL